MQFEFIEIKNFRNFLNVRADLSNKNIFFGLNDVGKTNFLHALRYVFDMNIRKQGLSEYDYHEKNTDIPVEIKIQIDISDLESTDTQKLIAKVKKDLRTSNKNKLIIKMEAKFNENEMVGEPQMFWGSDPEKLGEIPFSYNRYDLDRVINVVHIDSYVSLQEFFRKNAKKFINIEGNADKEIFNQIEKNVEELNTNISKLSSISEFEKNVTSNYLKYRDEKISIAVKSEIAVKGFHSSINPYIKDSKDQTYPTAGDGRKKILVYSIYNMISSEFDEEFINLFLIEEPENHLHKTLQITLSNSLFNDGRYQYLFMSTHSPYILYDMDGVNLVRIHKGIDIASDNILFSVPNEYKDNKKILNRNLSEAIFSDRTLLVEGPSEQILFEKVLSSIRPQYEAEGAYILPVNGIGFEKYLEVLKKLKIPVFVKTDNDLKRNKNEQYYPLGFSRCNRISQENALTAEWIKSELDRDDYKRVIFTENREKIEDIGDKKGIYLSKIDLEEDLNEVMHDRLVEIFPDQEDVVKYLKSAKHVNMVEIANKLTYEDCQKIYDHYNFKCLKRLISAN